MQKEHQCSITYPPRGSKDSSIGINASTSSSIIAAYHALQIETELAKDALPFTHFVNIPLALDPDFTETVSEFRELLLLKYNNLRGMDESIIIQPSRMHLTLVTLKCFTDEDEVKAQQVMQSSAEGLASIIGDEPITLSFKSLELMNDDPSECNVLYIDVEDDAGKELVLEIAGFLSVFLFLCHLFCSRVFKTSLHESRSYCGDRQTAW